MKIKLISGSHLTATNKKHLKALISENILNAKVNRTTYILNKLNDFTFTVNIPSYEKSVITGKREIVNHVSKIEIIE